MNEENIFALALGIELARERESKGILQRQVAAAISRKQSTIARIECGLQPITVWQLAQIAEAIKIKPEALFKRARAKANDIKNLETMDKISKVAEDLGVNPAKLFRQAAKLQRNNNG